MGSTRRRFTDEYKERAVELVLESDRSIADVMSQRVSASTR